MNKYTPLFFLLLLLLSCSWVDFIQITNHRSVSITPSKTSPATQTHTNVPTWTDIGSIPPSISPSPTNTSTPPFPKNSLQIHFIDVGEGEATFILTPNGRTILIDGGNEDSGIVQYLQNQGIVKVDLMIATLPIANHIGGLIQVLQAYPVTNVAMNNQISTDIVVQRFLNAVDDEQAGFFLVRQGDILTVDGIEFMCLNPKDTLNTKINENSIVLAFIYGQNSFLFMGDAGIDTEANLIASNLLSKISLLKVGDHGSIRGSSKEFLDIIKPDVAVYFAGNGNTLHHPSVQTLANLHSTGTVIYGTDKNGTIIVTVDVNGFSGVTEK